MDLFGFPWGQYPLRRSVQSDRAAQCIFLPDQSLQRHASRHPRLGSERECFRLLQRSAAHGRCLPPDCHRRSRPAHHQPLLAEHSQRSRLSTEDSAPGRGGFPTTGVGGRECHRLSGHQPGHRSRQDVLVRRAALQQRGDDHGRVGPGVRHCRWHHQQVRHLRHSRQCLHSHLHPSFGRGSHLAYPHRSPRHPCIQRHLRSAQRQLSGPGKLYLELYRQPGQRGESCPDLLHPRPPARRRTHGGCHHTGLDGHHRHHPRHPARRYLHRSGSGVRRARQHHPRCHGFHFVRHRHAGHGGEFHELCECGKIHRCHLSPQCFQLRDPERRLQGCGHRQQFHQRGHHAAGDQRTGRRQRPRHHFYGQDQGRSR